MRESQSIIDKLSSRIARIESPKLKYFLKRFLFQRYLMIMVLIPMAHIVLFQYVPIYGITLAFREFDPMRAFGGEWVGLHYFRLIFTNNYMFKVIRNTLVLSSISFVAGLPVVLTFALLMNEVREGKFKKISQTISYLPTFLSWVVVAGLVKQVLSPSTGLYGFICDLMGWEKIIILGRELQFVATLIISNWWKGIGYGAVVFLACISGINPELYQAAELDGATRLQRAMYITIPSLNNIITYSLIFAATGLLSSNFDQLYNLMNPLVMGIADVLDVYLLRVGIQQGQYSFSTAVGLLRSLVAVFFIVISNSIARKYSTFALW